jgi:hypothetical protein
MAVIMPTDRLGFNLKKKGENRSSVSAHTEESLGFRHRQEHIRLPRSKINATGSRGGKDKSSLAS